MKFSVTKNGRQLSKSLYTWDAKARTFSTEENNLILDFSDFDSVTFNTGSHCTFNTRNNCTFDTGSNCTFKTGSYCTFNTGDNCTLKTGNGCTFDTGSGCTFNTGSYCTFKTGYTCIFNTDSGCMFNTGSYCTFNTGSNCTFKTGYTCIFNTGSKCVNVRRDTFEFFEIPTGEEVKTCPIKIKGYVMDGYLYQDGEKKYKAIIADGILSEVIKKRENVYHVQNYGSEKETYLIKDGDIWSHGDTIEEARDSLIYKISNRDTSCYSEYTKDTKITKEEAIKMYRVITGACEAGTRSFCESHEIGEILTVRNVIEMTNGQYGNERIREYFAGK